MILRLEVDEQDLSQLRQALRRAGVNFLNAAEKREHDDPYRTVLLGRAYRFQVYEQQVKAERLRRQG